MLKRTTATAMVALLASCGETAGPGVDVDGAFITAPVEVTLPYGQEIQIGGTFLRLMLANVPEDSRCPTDVTCVWAGNAVVEVGIRAGMGPTFLLRLNTTLEPRSADWNEVRVTVLELTPKPTSTSAVLATAYAVKVRLESLS